MPTNAEIHAAIDLLVRQPHNHILTESIADLLDDIVDNISGGGGGGGITTVGDPISAADTKGATISGNTIRLHNANISGPGIVTNVAQDFEGDKTFTNKVFVNDELTAQQPIRLRSKDGSGFYSYLDTTGITGSDKTLSVPNKDGTISTFQGIDDVLAEGQVLTVNRTIGLGGNTFKVQQGGNDFLTTDPTAGSEAVIIQAVNITGNGNIAAYRVNSSNLDAIFITSAAFNDGNTVEIRGTSNVSGSSLEYSADAHTFSAGGQINGGISLPSSFIRGFDSTGNGNYSIVDANASAVDASSKIQSIFNDGVKECLILLNANTTSSSITYTADRHIFPLTGVPTFADDAAAAGGGLTAGMLYKTTTGGSTFVKIVP